MFPADELTSIREDLSAGVLPDLCNITAGTRTPDGMGGWSDGWGTVGSSIPCRLDFRGGKESVTSGALVPYTSAILTLPQSTTITTDNRVEHGGNVYTVQAVNLGSWLGVKRVTVEKI